MPFIPNTPESFLARSDSKNPSTTCKGITSTGRACRRSLAALVRREQDDLSTPRNDFGTVQITHHHNALTSKTIDEAVFYCWQHKDQAISPDDAASQTRTEIFDLKSRSSLDSLVKRLGLLDLKHVPPNTPKKSSIPLKSTTRRSDLRKQRDPHQEDAVKLPENREYPRVQHRSRGRRRGLRFSCFFCMVESGHDDGVIHANQPRKALATTPQMSTVRLQPVTPLKTSVHPRDSSEKAEIDLDSRLLAESNRPLSVNDEPGYIYVFVLSKDNIPAATTMSQPQASTNLPSTKAPVQLERTSEILLHQREGKLLLKIGRASNVQRRMNEWTRQCGYTLKVMRFYPQDHRSVSTSSVISEPQPAPHIKAVERLVHIELSQDRAAWKCSGCGKLHREWFEIEATREAVKRVDGVIRSWISWAREKSPNLQPIRETAAGYF